MNATEHGPLQHHMAVKVCLTKKHADRIDGVELTAYRPGDLLDLPRKEARLLIAEESVAIHSEPLR